MKIISKEHKTLEKQKLNFSRSTLFHMNSRVCLKYFVHDYSYIRIILGLFKVILKSFWLKFPWAWKDFGKVGFKYSYGKFMKI